MVMSLRGEDNKATPFLLSVSRPSHQNLSDDAVEEAFDQFHTGLVSDDA